MTLILELSPELETRLANAAQANGKDIQAFLIDAAEFAMTHNLGSEAERLAAIDEFFGAARDSDFNVDALHQMRREEHQAEEDKYERHFGKAKGA